MKTWLVICGTCGAAVPERLREKHVNYHALQANMMEALRQIAPLVGLDDMRTTGRVTIDFEILE